jgi:hypothetical protein
MDLRINEINSNVIAAGRSTFLAPEMLSAIVEAVLAELDRRQRERQTAEQEREPQQGVAPRPWQD